jgi:metal-sulfur cluster biosynthetic enzyme
MTLTTPNCPVAESFPNVVQTALWFVDGVSDVNVELVWEPPWSSEQMTEAARLQLGLL